MGQKRELKIEVKFTEADKECLARLVKELQKVGAEGSKVRAVPRTQTPPFGTFPRNLFRPIRRAVVR